MLADVLDVLAPAPGRVLLDGTLGLGGHARAWLEATAPDGRVVGVDRDAGALARARDALAPFGERLETHHASYKEIPELLPDLRPDALLLDLGLGSHQVDDPERGFAFRHEGPLDMRFDRDRPGRTAAELLAQSSAPELSRIFSEYGEERAAKKLARIVVEERQREAIRTTTRLAELVRSALPAPRAKRGGPRLDPATRVFQALRIAVNDELEGLGEALEELVLALRPGGRVAVLAFHSLEDRVVKRTLRALAAPRRDPHDPRVPDEPGPLELVERKPRVPGERETAENPRARSAKLRWGVRR
jgi:16S rRNA (cytosine1402-N4)-methyltransferase